jgi:hypothetical protein
VVHGDLHDEQPPPSSDAMDTIESEQARSDETAESVAELLEKV